MAATSAPTAKPLGLATFHTSATRAPAELLVPVSAPLIMATCSDRVGSEIPPQARTAASAPAEAKRDRRKEVWLITMVLEYGFWSVDAARATGCKARHELFARTMPRRDSPSHKRRRDENPMIS